MAVSFLVGGEPWLEGSFGRAVCFPIGKGADSFPLGTVRGDDMARILVIDDSMSAIQKARDILEKAGHMVENLDLLIYLPQTIEKNPPDLILLDLSMPALSGVNVASFIRRYQKEPIPIVLYSSRPVEEIKATAKTLEANGFVQKGEPDDMLVEVVSRVLARRRPARG